jgi:diketogulonate reductase-like aldo/keto reductase
LIDVPTVQLSNGVHMPQVGLTSATSEVVPAAVTAGFRSFELTAGLAEVGIPRHELFVVARTGDNPRNLNLAGLEYVDLCLLDGPVDDFAQTWKAFEKFAADGRTRAIGVSGFLIPHLRRLSEETGTVPAVNRVELRPGLLQSNLRAYHGEHGIVTQAYRPLTINSDIEFMAQKYGKTPTQIVVRWHVELKHVVAVEPDVLDEALDVFDFELAEDDVLSLSEVDD